MQYRTPAILIIGASLVAFAPVTGRAQYGGAFAAMSGAALKNTVSGTGTVILERKPTALRMHVGLLAKGDTLKDALAKLKERREAALLQLETLGAKKDSIKFGNPSLSNLQSQQKRQFEMMVRQRLSARGRKLPKGLKAPKSVTVSMTASAEWPLEADTVEGLLLAAETIRSKVKETDIAGAKEAETPSPEEEELAEEMAAMMHDSGEEQVKPGEPHFLYVARISNEERDKAMAEAFQKAKKQAAEIAAAAGLKVGPLVTLGGQGGGQANVQESPFGGYAQQQYLQHLLGQQGGFGDGQKTDEASSLDPSSLKFRFYVHAVFNFDQ